MNEKTSKRVAAIAGRVLKKIAVLSDYEQKTCGFWWDEYFIVSFKDLKALCASALTQAADKRKKRG